MAQHELFFGLAPYLLEFLFKTGGLSFAIGITFTLNFLCSNELRMAQHELYFGLTSYPLKFLFETGRLSFAIGLIPFFRLALVYTIFILL